MRATVLLYIAWFLGVCAFVNMNVFFPDLLQRKGYGSVVNSVWARTRRGRCTI